MTSLKTEWVRLRCAAIALLCSFFPLSRRRTLWAQKKSPLATPQLQTPSSSPTRSVKYATHFAACLNFQGRRPLFRSVPIGASATPFPPNLTALFHVLNQRGNLCTLIALVGVQLYSILSGSTTFYDGKVGIERARASEALSKKDDDSHGRHISYSGPPPSLASRDE